MNRKMMIDTLDEQKKSLSGKARSIELISFFVRITRTNFLHNFGKQEKRGSIT